MSSYRDYKEKVLQNPEVKAEYDPMSSCATLENASQGSISETESSGKIRKSQRRRNDNLSLIKCRWEAAFEMPVLCLCKFTAENE